MRLKILVLTFIFSFGYLNGLVSTFAQDAKVKTIELLPTQTSKGMPLMQALKERISNRDFSAAELPLQLLSDLLWAANGINRKDGKRTAPTAMNMQEIDVYVAKSDGLYLHDAKNNLLKLVLDKDIRAITGKQTFVALAPLNLIFVVNYNKMGKVADAQRDFYAAVDTGFISQNVYLFCASEGLSTVVRGWFDEEALTKAMQLNKNQKVLLTQTVGYPKQ